MSAGGCPFIHSNESLLAPTAPTSAAAVPDVTAEQLLMVSPQGEGSILGFHVAHKEFLSDKDAVTAALSMDDATASAGGAPPKPHAPPTHYGSYLGIETLLNLQNGPAAGKVGGQGLVHHEELTFIIVHQVFELWFKLVTADLTKSREYLMQLLDGKEGSLATEHQRQSLVTECLQYLRRSETIFHHAQQAFSIMETMHPADFIEFRDYLVPASGFQSVSFRSLEQLLGVPNETRAKVNGATVFSYLTAEEQSQLHREAGLPSVNTLVIRILSKVNVPKSFREVYLSTNRKILEEQQFQIAHAPPSDPKALALIAAGAERLQSMIDDPASWSEGLALEGEESHEEYRRAVLAALFIISYRHESAFSHFASLLDALIAVEEGMLLWRGRHLHMAERMIGRRAGTGGTSSGVGYLDLTRRYRVFHALWLVRKMFIRASALPPLASYGVDFTSGPL